MPSEPPAKSPVLLSSGSQAPRAEERERMVRTQLEARDITNADVLAAMRAVPRHEFVPDDLVDQAYCDGPLPIGHGVTISQPYVVALMIQLARVRPGDRVLDVGTGSGYQAAVLAAMGAEVYGLEIIESLASATEQRLRRLGYSATIRVGDGWAGWPKHAPFDAIVVAAAPTAIPPALTDQLVEGGRLVLPLGGRGRQDLVVVTRAPTGVHRRTVIPVAFVPMTGRAQH
ncbi:protein-L-isoaspartate(D-aspartate) O-methyltransferase [Paraliomyxa miuraensis]|uniref:protein-L-isoaspartate(D-aspartate) O-methyltransferase n=1 Tax=Paraliomyxa miuraensis TaxID=376150 RepID=UPI00225957D8|nr:protein-L-isoaspartate(D-aspartate) O-methyltransferase [Paraliomyxa miuraensis]MCX4245836.1 protein-L-isoaspartate(D-aspartate) O-methyltransferase [Paraliomyxa miuraensis]